MRQHKPSQAHRIAALLDDYQPHCSNEMREMYIADPPRRVNDLEEEGYIIKKEYCTMHSYHDGLPKMYTLISKPSKLPEGKPFDSVKFLQHVEKVRSVLLKDDPTRFDTSKPETPRINDSVPSQPISRGYAYSRTEPEVCCQIFKVSGFTHSQGCETQKVNAIK